MKSNFKLFVSLSLASALLFLLTQTLQAQKDEVVFKEDFESASIKEIFTNWDDLRNAKGMSFSLDVPSGSKGKQSLMMAYNPGSDNGGHLYKMFPEGYDTLYARFYVKFVTSYSRVHHLVSMGGYDIPSKWPIGKAGIRPEGNDRFTTNIEPIGDNWSWNFYSYWKNMRGCAQPGFYWGNTFYPYPPAEVKQDKWTCVEIMVILNNPVDSWNGQQAFWINGKKVIHLGKGFPNGYWKWDRFIVAPDSIPFEGFQFRTTNQLKINYFSLSYYMTDGKPGEIDKILFDDIIISTKYIGPF